ncbi:MAG: type II CAAX endopeptidase family protein [Thermotogota bacterium]|nr:type II CAAX endopeptidase family protein [Thermotogota bacterium]
MRDLVNVFIYLVIYHAINIFVQGSLRKKKLNPYKIVVMISPMNILLILYFAYLTDLNSKQMGFTPGNTFLGLLMILIVFVYVFISVRSILKAPSKEIRKIRYGITSNRIYQYLYGWVIVGIVEEFLFRGYLQGNLDRFFNESFLTLRVSTLLASGIFVLIHTGNVISRFETWKQFFKQLPLRLFGALLLGYTFQITDSLIYPIIMHNLIDGSSMTAIIFRKQKMKLEARAREARVQEVVKGRESESSRK